MSTVTWSLIIINVLNFISLIFAVATNIRLRRMDYDIKRRAEQFRSYRLVRDPPEDRP